MTDEGIEFTTSRHISTPHRKAIMFKATRVLAMQPTRLMMMRPTRQAFMRASPQLVMRETLRLRSPVPVRLYTPSISRDTANSYDRRRSTAVRQLASPLCREPPLTYRIAHTVSQRIRQLKNIPTEIWPLSTFRAHLACVWFANVVAQFSSSGEYPRTEGLTYSI